MLIFLDQNRRRRVGIAGLDGQGHHLLQLYRNDFRFGFVICFHLLVILRLSSLSNGYTRPAAVAAPAVLASRTYNSIHKCLRIRRQEQVQQQALSTLSFPSVIDSAPTLH